MSNENINEKIRKLLVLSRDNGASENEQAQALKLAQRLMIKYGIDNVDTETGEVKYGDMITELDKKYCHVIAGAVGRMYGAHPVFSGKHFRFAGRNETREAAEFTTHFICDQIDYFYRDALPKGMSKPERAQYRREFKTSCAYRVATRIEEMIKELTTDDKVANEAIGCTAVVVLNHFDQLKAEVDSFLEGKTVPRRTRPTIYKNQQAITQGRAAGEKVKINQQVNKTMPKQLAGGSKNT